MKKGWFITFEGTEGSGKTTQINLLAKRLESQGHPVLLLREPGGTAIGEEIRHTLQHSQEGQSMTPETELLLLNASRAQLVREKIRPALEQGIIVCCDRFYDSTVAYQGYGRGLDLSLVDTIINLAVGETRPHLTFLLLLPEKERGTRLEGRLRANRETLDRMERAGNDFFGRVEQGYRAVAREQSGRIQTLDASAEVDDLSKQIWASIQGLFASHQD